MKKYIILSLLSLSIILTTFATGYTKVAAIDYVSAVKVEKMTAVELLHYNGTVEYRNSSVCTSNGTGMVQSVLVNNGDFVQKGDPVLTVYQTNADITRSDIMSFAAAGSYDELLSGLDGDFSVTVYEAKNSGIISSLDLEEGSVFQKGQTLFKISPEKSFQIQINVVEKDITKIKVGQNVKIDCKALPDILYGTVKSIGNSASQTNTTNGKETTVKVIVSIDGQCSDIKSGYTANCSITVSEKENTLLVPYSSVSKDERGDNYVYIAAGNDIKKRNVTIGTEYNNGVEIKKGLQSGDIIVYDASGVDVPDDTIVNEVRINAQ